MSKNQLPNPDNSRWFSTSVCSSTIFQKMAKNAIFASFNYIFFEKLKWWKDSCSMRKMHSETPGAILFAKPMQGCVILRFFTPMVRYGNWNDFSIQQRIWAGHFWSIVCWLIRRGVRVRASVRISKQNTKNNFFSVLSS